MLLAQLTVEMSLKTVCNFCNVRSEGTVRAFRGLAASNGNAATCCGGHAAAHAGDLKFFFSFIVIMLCCGC